MTTTNLIGHLQSVKENGLTLIPALPFHQLDFDNDNYKSVRTKIMWKTNPNEFYTYVKITNKMTDEIETYHVSGDVTEPWFTVYKFEQQ